MANRKETEARHKEFKEYVRNTQHFKLNSKILKEGIFIETRQYNKTRNHWSLNGYWTNPAIKVLVFGNEDLQLYFNKNRLWHWLKDNYERIGEYGNVKGVSLSIRESMNLADMIIK